MPHRAEGAETRQVQKYPQWSAVVKKVPADALRLAVMLVVNHCISPPQFIDKRTESKRSGNSFCAVQVDCAGLE